MWSLVVLLGIHPVIELAQRQPVGAARVSALVAVVQGAQSGPLADEALEAAAQEAGADGTLRLQVVQAALAARQPQRAMALLDGVAEVPPEVRAQVAVALVQAGVPVDLAGAPPAVRTAVVMEHVRRGQVEVVDRLIGEAPADQQGALVESVLKTSTTLSIGARHHLLARLEARLGKPTGALAIARVRLLAELADPRVAEALAAVPAEQRPPDLVSRVAGLVQAPVSAAPPAPHRRWVSADPAALAAEARANPAAVAVWVALAEAHLGRNELGPARAALAQAARRLTGEDSDSAVVVIAVRLNDYATARRIALGRATYSQRFDLLADIGRRAVEAGRPAQAVAAARALSRLVDFAELPPEGPCEVPGWVAERSDLFVELADSLSENGHFAEARAILDGVQPERARMEALLEWATHEHRSPPDALAAARTLTNPRPSCGEEPEPLRERALAQVATTAADQRWFEVSAQAIAELHPTLGDFDARPSVLGQVLSTFAEADRLDLLAPAIKELRGEAEQEWLEALAGHHLQWEQPDQALAAITRINDPLVRLRLLAQLARHLDPGDKRLMRLLEAKK